MHNINSENENIIIESESEKGAYIAIANTSEIVNGLSNGNGSSNIGK